MSKINSNSTVGDMVATDVLAQPATLPSPTGPKRVSIQEPPMEHRQSTKRRISTLSLQPVQQARPPSNRASLQPTQAWNDPPTNFRPLPEHSAGPTLYRPSVSTQAPRRQRSNMGPRRQSMPLLGTNQQRQSNNPISVGSSLLVSSPTVNTSSYPRPHPLVPLNRPRTSMTNPVQTHMSSSTVTLPMRPRQTVHTAPSTHSSRRQSSNTAGGSPTSRWSNSQPRRLQGHKRSQSTTSVGSGSNMGNNSPNGSATEMKRSQSNPLLQYHQMVAVTAPPPAHRHKPTNTVPDTSLQPTMYRNAAKASTWPTLPFGGAGEQETREGGGGIEIRSPLENHQAPPMAMTTNRGSFHVPEGIINMNATTASRTPSTRVPKPLSRNTTKPPPPPPLLRMSSRPLDQIDEKGILTPTTGTTFTMSERSLSSTENSTLPLPVTSRAENKKKKSVWKRLWRRPQMNITVWVFLGVMLIGAVVGLTLGLRFLAVGQNDD